MSICCKSHIPMQSKLQSTSHDQVVKNDQWEAGLSQADNCSSATLVFMYSSKKSGFCLAAYCRLSNASRALQGIVLALASNNKPCMSWPIDENARTSVFTICDAMGVRQHVIAMSMQGRADTTAHISWHACHVRTSKTSIACHSANVVLDRHTACCSKARADPQSAPRAQGGKCPRVQGHICTR